MDAANHVRLSTPAVKLLALACAASVLTILAGGRCGGRVVSVRLYDDDQAPACLDGHQGEIPFGSHGHFAGLGHRGERLAAAAGTADFQGPALIAPLPRFHPVPTRPVFEPREERAPLKVLPLEPSAADDSNRAGEPTPASAPSVLVH